MPDGWPLPDFEPGQFAVLGLPGSAPRHRLSEPEERPAAAGQIDPACLFDRIFVAGREYMDFYLHLVGSGALTPRLFALNMGDRVWLGPKITGMFTLDQVPPRTRTW